MYNPLHALYDIIDIGKVAFAVSVVENLNLFALHQLIRKPKVGHIRATSRAINRKEAQTGRGNIIQLAVRMSSLLFFVAA